LTNHLFLPRGKTDSTVYAFRSSGKIPMIAPASPIFGECRKESGRAFDD
jgi:hypothetical protein